MRQANDPAILALAKYFEKSQHRGTLPSLSLDEFEDLIAHYDGQRASEQIMEVLDCALQQYPYSVYFYLKKADFLLAQNRTEEALEVIDDAAGLSPDNFEVLILSIEALTLLGQMELAGRLLDELPSPIDAEQQADYYYAQAFWHEQRYEFERMYFFLCAALEILPSHQRSLEKMMVAVEMNKRYQEAIPLYEHILDQDPYSYQAWFNMGQALASTGAYERALEAMEYAYIIDPHFELAYRDFIDLSFELGHYQQTLRCFEELTNHFLLDAEDTQIIARCFWHLGQYSKAQESFNEAIQLDPHNDDTYYYLGECLTEQELFQPAIHYYSKAIQLDEKREEYFAARGEAFLLKGELEAAEADFIQATQIAPESGHLWVQYCSFLMQGGRAKEALSILSQQRSLEDIEMLYCRVACLFMLGKRKEAKYWLSEALSEAYEAHPLLFDLIPDLEMDADITALIANHW
ncbi:MAG TPA: tetratricopeptide repeat protein [Saprospiraceae bacterium]|nr:tetratricopeptide repeat protein [Saprospiraceae bacterium]